MGKVSSHEKKESSEINWSWQDHLLFLQLKFLFNKRVAWWSWCRSLWKLWKRVKLKRFFFGTINFWPYCSHFFQSEKAISCSPLIFKREKWGVPAEPILFCFFSVHSSMYVYNAQLCVSRSYWSINQVYFPRFLPFPSCDNLQHWPNDMLSCNFKVDFLSETNIW